MRKVLLAASFLLAPGVASADVDVTLGGFVKLSWYDDDASPIFNTLNTAGAALTAAAVGAKDAVVGTTRDVDAELHMSASVDIAGLTWLGQADLGLAGIGEPIKFQRALIGLNTGLGDIFYRDGGVRSDYFSYASDLSVGGSGVSAQLLDHSHADLFSGDEVGYHLGFGDLDVEVTYDLEQKALSGQVQYGLGLAGYDFDVSLHGVSSGLSGGTLKTYATKYTGLGGSATVDLGDLSVGLSLGQDELTNYMLQSTGNETDVKRQFGSIAMAYTVLDALTVSFDADRLVTTAEWGCTGIESECLVNTKEPTSPAYFDAGIGGGSAASAEVSTSFSIGAEYQATKEVSVGAFFRQVNDGLDVALDNTTAVGLNRGFKFTDGQAFGMQAKITF